MGRYGPTLIASMTNKQVSNLPRRGPAQSHNQAKGRARAYWEKDGKPSAGPLKGKFF